MQNYANIWLVQGLEKLLDYMTFSERSKCIQSSTTIRKPTFLAFFSFFRVYKFQIWNSTTFVLKLFTSFEVRIFLCERLALNFFCCVPAGRLLQNLSAHEREKLENPRIFF